MKDYKNHHNLEEMLEFFERVKYEIHHPLCPVNQCVISLASNKHRYHWIEIEYLGERYQLMRLSQLPPLLDHLYKEKHRRSQ
jgi:hypothetical protein